MTVDPEQELRKPEFQFEMFKLEYEQTWLVAIYIPMDSYGQQSRQRLANIEEDINEELLKYSQKQMRHFLDFQPPRRFNLQKLEWRVKDAMLFFTGVTVIVWLALLIFMVSSQPKSNPTRMEIKLESPVQIQTQDSQFQDLKKEINSLSKKLDSIGSLIRARNTATSNNAGKP